jgi:hypothetical protein
LPVRGNASEARLRRQDSQLPAHRERLEIHGAPLSSSACGNLVSQRAIRGRTGRSSFRLPGRICPKDEQSCIKCTVKSKVFYISEEGAQAHQGKPTRPPPRRLPSLVRRRLRGKRMDFLPLSIYFKDDLCCSGATFSRLADKSVLPPCYPSESPRRQISCKPLKSLARPRGFEPLTFAFGGQRSIQTLRPQQFRIGSARNQRPIPCFTLCADTVPGSRRRPSRR